jgi:hypothetical protein
MDPVTEMTVSSKDWLICSVISDSFLTLKNNRVRDRHNHQGSSASSNSDRHANIGSQFSDLLRLLLTAPRFVFSWLLLRPAPPNRLLAPPAA